MILTLLLIALSTAGGTAITYLYEKHDTLMARIAAGNVIGSVIFGTVGFVVACAIGLNPLTVIVALAAATAPAALIFVRKDIAKEFKHDRAKAKGKLQGITWPKAIRFGYYAGLMLLMLLFFERAMIENETGILTGGSQNLGDLPFHLGAIFSFSEGNNFPPENPSYSGAKFTYPFLVDLITAFALKLGAGVREAMLVQNLTLGFSLIVLLEKFVFRLTDLRKAGKIAVLILLFSGGLGFAAFLRDYWQGTQGFADLLFKLGRDYTIGENFRWGNSLVVLFLTQRGLLFGMPLTLIVLTRLWDIFASPKAETGAGDAIGLKPLLPSFLVGLLAGTLPLIHVHSLAALFVVCAFLFFLRFDRLREWLAFGAGVCLIAVPELLWSLTGSASKLSQFIGWHFGWDAKDESFLFFWFKNTGLFLPLLFAGIFLVYDRSRREPGEPPKLIYFVLPFAFLFLVSNTIKLAPWEWDNIKVLIYWFVGSLPFVALAVAWVWERGTAGRLSAAGLMVVLTASGALDVWRTVSRQINYGVFQRDSVKLAAELKMKTAPGAMFLNAPTYNTAVVLTGRRSVMRYSGHLGSYGIDYADREDAVRRIYEGGADAERLLAEYGVDYVVISPEEIGYAQEPGRRMFLNEQFFRRFPVIAEVGQFRVHKIR